MLTRAKTFSLTMAALLVLTLVPGTPTTAAPASAPDHAQVAAVLQSTPGVHRDVDHLDEHAHLDQRDEGQPEPAAEPPARVGTNQHMSSPEGQPADQSLAQGIIEHTCPITTTTYPVFWDTPPQSGSVIVSSSGQETIQPGPDDEVRVIIQLEGEPVWAYKFHLQAASGRLTSAEHSQIRAYASEVQRSHQRLIGKVKAQGIELEVGQEFSYIFNGLAASVKMGDVEWIEALPQVRAVYPDYQVHALLDDSVPLIGADQVWTMLDPGGQPVTGQGIRVAILDTGIDYTHPDLGGCFGAGCKVIGGYDFVNYDADPMDDDGHGTQCAGIVAANGAVKGVAPDATLYAYKVLDGGFADESVIIAAIEQATDPDGDPVTNDAVDVINLSLAAGHDPEGALALAVDAAVDQGTVVVASAGNSGPEYQTIVSPGVARKAFTVGSTDKSDNIAEYSSRGPVPDFYKLIKPDIVAPGVDINSTYPGGGYHSFGGTSAAAPHVAGAVALIKQLHPTWTPAMIQANLMNTARDLGLNIYTQGAGRVQVDDAARVQAVLTPGSMGFGLVDPHQPLWTKSEILWLTNVTTSPISYSLYVSGTLPTGVTTSLEPAIVTLSAGESVTVSFQITVDNALVPFRTEEPGSYEGQVVAQSVAEHLVVPFAFTKMPRLEMTFAETPWIVSIHDGEEVQAERWNPGNPLSILLPAGTYDILTVYPDGATWVIREGVVVSSVTSLSISRSDAVHTITLAPQDKDGQAIAVQDGDRLIQHLTKMPLGFNARLYGWDVPPLELHFSDVSTAYTLEWRLDTAWASDWYEFNDRLTGISGDMTYQNDPAAFVDVAYHWHPGPSPPDIQVRPWVSTNPHG